VVISGGYQFLDAVPRNVFTFQARYSNPRRLTVAFQGRAGGAQFDDDQNQLRLDPYFTLDAFASRSLGRGVEVVGAFENLTGQRYDIGRTPVRTVGPPGPYWHQVPAGFPLTLPNQRKIRALVTEPWLRALLDTAVGALTVG
jgi:outer membrane receptor protein involved in Fe transport